MTLLLRYPNQGQKIAPGWDNVAGLKDITAYFGADSERFLPVDDRRGYNAGTERDVETGGVLYSGIPTQTWETPWLSDGQLYAIINTLLAGATSGNVTVATHIPGRSVGVTSVFRFNAVLNVRINQFATLTRRRFGYEAYLWQLRLVEEIV